MNNHQTHFSHLIKGASLLSVAVLGIGTVAPSVPVLTVAAATANSAETTASTDTTANTSTTETTSATATTSTTASGTTDNTAAAITADPYLSASTPTDASGLAAYSQFQVTTTAGATETGPMEQVGTAMQAIIDQTQFASLGLLSTLHNTTAGDITINAVFNLPTATSTAVTATATAAPTISQDAGLTVLYQAVDTKYRTLQAYEDAGKTWSELKAIQIKGTLAANQTVQVTTPLAVTGLAAADLTKEASTELTTTSFTYNAAGRSLATKGIIYFANAVPANYTGYNAIDPTGANWDSATQSLLKGLVPRDDITALNFGGSTPSGTTLFTTGRYALDLSRIKAAVNPAGYSVGLSSNGTQLSQYTYATPDKMSTTLNVTLIKVLTTKDSNLTVGDTWSAADNLVAATSPVDGTDITSKVTTSGTVNTTKAGTYPVTYAYQLGSETISQTATVTVTGATDLGNLIDTSKINSSAVDSETNTSATPDEQGGYQHYSQFAVTGTDGTTAYSPIAKFLTTDDLKTTATTTPNAIVNALNFKSLALIGTIKNTTNGSLRIRTAFSLPSSVPVTAATRLYARATAAATAVAGSTDGLTLYYSNGDGNYFPLDEFLSKNDNDYQKIAVVMVDGTLRKGQNLQLSIPLAVSSSDSAASLATMINTINNNNDHATSGVVQSALRFTSRTFTFSQPTATISSTGRLGSYATFANSAIYNNVLFALPVKLFTNGFLATYLTGDDSYVTFPEDVQALLDLPEPVAHYLQFKNYIANAEFSAYDAKNTGTYTTGSYRIVLDDIKDKVNPAGLSVVVDSSGKQVDYYTYRTGTSNSFSLTNSDGSDSGSTARQQEYIELIQVLETTSSKFKVGSSEAHNWTTTTNLVPGKNPATKAALTSADFNVAVTDAQGQTITDPETYLAKTPGIYTVTYSYQLVDSVISKQATVTVLADQSLPSGGNGGDDNNSGNNGSGDTNNNSGDNGSDGNTNNPGDNGSDGNPGSDDSGNQDDASNGAGNDTNGTNNSTGSDSSDDSATNGTDQNTTGTSTAPTLPMTGATTTEATKPTLPQTNEQSTKVAVAIGLALLGATSVLLGHLALRKRQR